MLLLRAIVLPVVMLGLVACTERESVKANLDPGAPPPAPNMAPIAAGTALPAGYKVDTDRTIIFGTGEAWTGRLTYSTSTSTGPDEVFDFLHTEMPNFGWTEVTAMRANPSLLTFSSSATNRTATITIVRSSAIGNTRVDMVVSPNGTSARR